MLRVLRDPNASKQRRDRMAVVAARYVHPRMSDYRVPKKDQRAAEAKKAGGSDTEWAGDLDPDGHRPQ
jgi:hypothetical protein